MKRRKIKGQGSEKLPECLSPGRAKLRRKKNQRERAKRKKKKNLGMKSFKIIHNHFFKRAAIVVLLYGITFNKNGS